MNDIAISPTLSAWDARRAMERDNPLLALAYRVEAAGDRRIGNDMCAAALLTELRDEARRMIERHTGTAFRNELYRG